MKPFTVTTTKEITREQVDNLLCNAFEGGSNYWYCIEKENKPTTFEFYTWPKEAGKEQEVFSHIDYPLNPGGSLIISDREGAEYGKMKRRALNLRTIQSGLQLMAESKEYAHHWRDFIAENDDAITADVFLQFCLFGDVIYS